MPQDSDPPGESREPVEQGRCPTSPRQPVSAELIEANPVSHSVVNAAARLRFPIDDPDDALVTAWLDGDESAFEQLVRRHERRVFGLLMRMLGDREEAADVAQEAFLSLHRHGHRFRREAKFSTFVYRVAANAALNRRRSLGRKRAREQALMRRHEAGIDLPSSPRNPEDATAGGEVQEQVQRALLELSPDLRAALVLYDLEGESYGDIAETLQIPEGTVKSRIHRARNALREHLRPLVSDHSEGETS
jgi:RNA polymerase sigma-70 factor (ECF subfamily)